MEPGGAVVSSGCTVLNAVLDNSTRLRVVNVLLCDADEGSVRRDSDASHGDAGSKLLAGSECRAFTNCFVLRFVSRVSFTGFTGSMGPGRISAKRSTSAFNAPLKGQSLHAVFPAV